MVPGNVVCVLCVCVVHCGFETIAKNEQGHLQPKAQWRIVCSSKRPMARYNLQ